MEKPATKSRSILFANAVVAFVISAVALLIWGLQGGLEKELVPAYSAPEPHWKELRGPLVQTHWRQDGPYAAITPGGELLGCWSIAFAQVLAYHRLAPRGRVRYEPRQAVIIDENLTSAVNWNSLVSAIEPVTSAESRAEIARYCYNAAVVMQKDFGRGEYRNLAQIPDEVGEHYGCAVERVNTRLAETARSELRLGRPLVAYFNDILQIRIVRNGHAGVLDGMAKRMAGS